MNTPVEQMNEQPAHVPDNAKWYIIHTYSGHENKVSKALRQRAETMGYGGNIFDIIVLYQTINNPPAFLNRQHFDRINRFKLPIIFDSLSN